MNITETGPKLKEIISIESADMFESRYSNLLVCFDAGSVFSAIATLFRLEGLPEEVKNDFSCATLCKATEDAFLTLLKRGALDESVKVSPLPEAAQVELDKMSGVVDPANEPAVDDRAARAAAIEQCVEDFRGGLDSRSFRNKYLSGDPAHRTIYESAIAAGRI